MSAGRAGIEGTEADALKRDVQRTQDSLETVHGTLGHVVDRLATIEAGIRNPPPRGRQHRPAGQPSRRRWCRPRPSPACRFPTSCRARRWRRRRRRCSARRPPPSRPRRRARTRRPLSERRPIDPNLPPDHPLEPGAGRSRGGNSPADRIAASEAALENVRPPVIPDPAGKSNFIAAARRAAQAAIVEAPPPKEKRAGEPAEGEPPANR